MWPISPGRRRLLIVSLAALAAAVLFVVLERGTAGNPPSALRAARQLAAVRLPFIANEDPSSNVSFYASTFAGTTIITRSAELVYVLTHRENSEPGQPGALSPVILTETFAGGRVAVPRGGSRSSTTVNLFRGNEPAKWRRQLPTYDSVKLDAVYDGVDVEIKSYGRSIEKVFTVQPGAAVDDIRMRVEGGGAMRIKDGALEVTTVGGRVTFSRPVAFQETDGTRTMVAAAYELDGDTYGFRVGSFDRTRPLVIDPVLAATYLGGAFDELVTSLVTDSAGNVFAAGIVTDPFHAADLPGIGAASADPDIARNDVEGFVVKLDSNLQTILAATYLGGSDDDMVYALAIDASDTLYLGGATWSADLPGIGAMSAASVLAGASDAFVTRLDPTLSAPPVSTYLGGTGSEDAAIAGELISAIAVDAAGDIVVAGFTFSPDFPGITRTSPDSEYAGYNEAFVAKLDPSLSMAPISTFLGGEDCDSADALGLDPETGDIYVGGFTRSVDFPFVSLLSADHVFAGGSEAWLARLDASLKGFTSATFLGGTEEFDREVVTSIAVGPGVTVYAAGTTFAEDFPGISEESADHDSHDGEGFVAGLGKDLSGVQRATFLGGNTWDYISAITLVGEVVFVAGSTMSFVEFPDAEDGSYHGCGTGLDYEAFVASLEFLREVLTFQCLARDSEAHAIAADDDLIYVGGVVLAPLLAVPPDAADPTAVPLEGFVVKLGPSDGMGFFAQVSLLRDILIPECACPDRVKHLLTQKLVQAENHAKKSHPEAAAHALQQFMAIIEREVEVTADTSRLLSSRAARGRPGPSQTLSQEEARRFLAVVQLALADLPEPRAAGDRGRFDRRFLARLKTVSRDCACRSATIRRFRTGLDAEGLPSCQACMRGACLTPTPSSRASSATSSSTVERSRP